MRVLIDNSILSDAQILEPVQEDLDGYVNKLALVRMRPKKPLKEVWRREQIECLPTIARIARDGWIELCTYPELTYEHWRARGSYGGFGGNLFAGVHISQLEAPVSRGIFQQTDRFIQSEMLTEFVEWLTEFYSDRILETPMLKEKINKFERDNLKNISSLRARCSKIERAHYGDAFHVWTGDVHGIPFFLTTDRRLINVATRNPKLFPVCVPISPSDFLYELDVVEKDEMPFEYGKTYLLNGKEY